MPLSVPVLVSFVLPLCVFAVILSLAVAVIIAMVELSLVFPVIVGPSVIAFAH
jgi:hypothetical protein